MVEKNDSAMWKTLGMAWNLGYLIALPLVGFALGGRLIDRIFGSPPLFFLIGVLTAIVLSSILIYRKIARLLDDQDNKTD